MAWKDTLLDAKFRGVTFPVMNVGRSGRRAIVANEFAYRAGAELEDTGLRARTVKLKAVIYGDSYEDQLDELVKALEAPGAGELIHPIHGSMTVMADAWDDEHDADLVDGVIVNMSFIEHTVRDIVFSADSASAKTDAIIAKADAARAAADDAIVRRVDSAFGSPFPRLTVLKDLFDQAKTQLTRLLDGTALRVILSDLDPLLYPRAYVADLRAVLDRALQGFPFGGRNMSFDASSGAAVALGSGLADFNTAQLQLQPSAIAVAPALPVPDAVMLEDAAAVQAHAQAHSATALAECAAIVLAGELEHPILERAEVEALAGQTRQALQEAMNAARAALDGEGRGLVATALRDVAYQVQEAALAVINQRPPLVRKESPISGPARLVAHAIYGDPSRAAEIIKLNRLGRRVFVERGDALSVYAA
ncbi:MULTISPECIES: DNA circularization N-terminal domain-containing protein [unclassified Polaromonas]|jgi:prophage DNA circulation protein|uniref:DNA circularization protein n=1 Tax=unclassified Polaromonas TaxID=2638319 RepID=UPI000BC7C8DE|nr:MULTISPECIES: DNA circularization N-terminal domain-containing protein [unclassified Polaromonas]OYY34580.1 MAG: hypothetical protein B7Y60_15995 [Polaromonas sp. 35-63-35]OYZ15069.1 MAG: hypothetical protein B7Y28_22635 [Polaromonas sp. 16-63-31]OYZ78860.1 MAG: hypothetical protein B7Y09_11295 [Polaromonas sp. 24-63-21]OZA49626.1 MAG: hypothetical protein B7X88_14535 [Polaromonas sp. 17-63-33]OZA86830.1 MAG: hypothetical protein B7X65_15285 [Polaromonas sp. 39-63-25]